MLARVSAAVSGIREYLEKGRKKGREYDRDLVDDRIALAGDIDLMDDTINEIQTKQRATAAICILPLVLPSNTQKAKPRRMVK